MRIVMVVAVAGLMLSGCSDPKKPSKSNFAHAINAYLEKHPLCVSAPTSDVTPAGHESGGVAYPAYLAKPTGPAGQQLFDMGAKRFEALVKAGLLSSKDASIPVKDMFSGDAKPIAVKEYDLTDAGNKAFSKGDGSRFDQKFCYGTAEVTEVTQYTEPSSALGATMSEVSYDYRIKDPAEWASDPAVLDAFPVLKSTSGDALHAKTSVVLMNDGWVDGRDSKM